MIDVTLQKTLDELGITRNKLAVEAKIRPATLHSLVKGDTTLIRFDTLCEILDTINNIADKKGIDKEYGIDDVIKYVRVWVDKKEGE